MLIKENIIANNRIFTVLIKNDKSKFSYTWQDKTLKTED